MSNLTRIWQNGAIGAASDYKETWLLQVVKSFTSKVTQ